MKKLIIKLINKFGKVFGIGGLQQEIITIKKILIEQYLENRVNADPKYQNPLKLNKYEYQVMSQGGEDGIIQEIFKRIGVTNKYFVEFGTGDGIENNSASLIFQNWTGLWIEGSHQFVDLMKNAYSGLISDNRLRIKEAFITTDNILDLFKEANVPTEFDLLSIDIDGNDYWIWDKLKVYRPRVVVIEYNASLGPSIKWVMPYNSKHYWSGSVGNYFGASLKSLELLGEKLGYFLIGCNLTGVNAFFVRKDLVNEDLFCSPFTSENHFEKPMYFLEKRLGHKRSHLTISNCINS